MNIFTQITKTLSGLAIAILASFAMMLAPMKASALSIPYNGENTPPAPYPAFNVYTGTPESGDEHDFLRGKVAGSTSPSTNDVSTACEDGTRFTLRVYVHNGASQYENGTGNGPSVAHNTKVKVGNVVNVTNSKFTPNATISSSNAASVSDSMNITCSNGTVVTMNYVKDSAKQYTVTGGTQPISNDIVTTGAAIGTHTPNGDVWGCWDQRVWVTLDVEVKKVPTPPVSAGVCKVADMKTLGGRKIEITVTGETQNAEIVGYEINWGDGSKSNKQSDTHEYAADGTYNIVTRVLVKYANGTTEWKTAVACTKQVTFKPGVPPVVPPTTPPTTLIAAGPGSVAGIFAAVSAAGAVAYRVFITRRLSRQ